VSGDAIWRGDEGTARGTFFLSFYGLQTHLFSKGTVASLGGGIRRRSAASGRWCTILGSGVCGQDPSRECGVLGGVVLLGKIRAGLHEGWSAVQRGLVEGDVNHRKKKKEEGLCRTRRGKNQSTQSRRRARAAARRSGGAYRPRGVGEKRGREWWSRWCAGRQWRGRSSGRSCASRPRPRRWRRGGTRAARARGARARGRAPPAARARRRRSPATRPRARPRTPRAPAARAAARLHGSRRYGGGAGAHERARQGKLEKSLVSFAAAHPGWAPAAAGSAAGGGGGAAATMLDRRRGGRGGQSCGSPAGRAWARRWRARGRRRAPRCPAPCARSPRTRARAARARRRGTRARPRARPRPPRPRRRAGARTRRLH